MIKTIRWEIENLVLWLVPLIVLSKAAGFISRVAFEKIIGVGHSVKITGEPLDSLLSLGFTVGDLFLILQYMQTVPLALIHLFIGVWLFIQAKKHAGRKWLWLIGGICLSYWAIVLFLFSLLLNTDRTEPVNSTSSV